MIINLRTFAIAMLAASVTMGFGQKPATPAAATPPAKPAAPAPKPGDLKKYEDVITKEAKTQTGLFKVHRIDDKVYWEIPTNLLGRLFLWQTEIAQLPSSLGYPGTAAGTRAIRFTRHGNHLYIRNAELDVRAAAEGAAAAGVDENSIEPIIGNFEVLTEGEGKAPVIDVTNLFTTDPQDFSVKQEIGASSVDSSKSYIDKVKAFPLNIETRSQLTFSMGGGSRFAGFGVNGGFDASAATVVVHYSMDLLPEKPMMGRLKDTRIGYFTTDFTEYGRPENRAVERRFINRYRLEKKDPSAAVSDPVKPVVFYLSREVPEKWRPCLKKAIEAWGPALEGAGFSNAIIAKDAPSVKEDPDWDPEDARYCVIRWAPSTTENAMGPSIQDPRSGETLSAHVIVWNDVVRLAEDWYFSQCAAIDPKARQIPMSDEMMGKLLTYVVTHEVGHTFGLEHDFKGSVAYSIAQLRDPAFTKEHGVAASIMSYSRFNYVAQPGDGVTQTWGMIGPYDKFAIEYGYKPIPGAATPDDEKAALDVLLSRQVSNKWLRFGNYLYSGTDPTTQSENISEDSIEAARLGFLNLDRIAKNFLMPSTIKFGDDYKLLAEMQGQLVRQRLTELLHIVPMVGGVVETDYHAGRGAGVFAPVPADRQAAAVHFIATRGLETPVALFDPRVEALISPSGIVDSATNVQSILISVLFGETRLHRLQDSEAVLGKSAYTIARLVDDVTNGAWSELSALHPVVDVYRRSMQRGFLRTMDGRINGAGASKTDFKPLARAELQGLAHRIDAVLPKVADRATSLHLADCRQDIERILQNKYSSAGGSGGAGYAYFGIAANDKGGAPKGCWDPNATLREAIQDAEN